MKRFRVISFDFDARANVLKTIGHNTAKDNVSESVKNQFGDSDVNHRITNLADFGAFFSVLPFLRMPFREIQYSFINGSFYPALTGACCLGESILNQLISGLKDEYPISKKFSKCLKDKYLKWDPMINELEKWGVLLPNVVINFKKLKKLRNSEGVHFNLHTHKNTRDVALRATNLLRDIINEQFGMLRGQPWFIEGTPGSCYIKKEYETSPFIKLIYLPYCNFVGPLHTVETYEWPFKIYDAFEYIDRNLSDEEFAQMVNDPEKYRDLILNK